MTISLPDRPLRRDPQQGKIMGVCAGLAEYLNVPVTLIRVMVIISMFAGLFGLTLVVYFALGWFLDKKAPGEEGTQPDAPTASERLTQLETELNADEQRVRDIERYVTSETFSVRSRFRQL